MSLIFFLKPHYRHRLAPEWPIEKPIRKAKRRRVYKIENPERPTAKEIDFKTFAVEIHALEKAKREERLFEDELITLLELLMELDNE